MKCALLSNVNVESIARRIERHEVHIAQGYGVWTPELADPTSGTFRFGPSSVFLIIDGEELLRGDRALGPVLAKVDEQLAWIEQAAERSPGVKFFVSTVDVPARTLRPLKEEHAERRLEEHWNSGIARASASHANIYVFDLKEMVAQMGRSSLFQQALVPWWTALLDRGREAHRPGARAHSRRPARRPEKMPAPRPR